MIPTLLLVYLLTWNCHVLFAVLSKGVVAVLGPQSKANSDHIRSIADNTEVPYIETRPALTERHQLSSINLHPDPDKMGDILGEVGWEREGGV